mmetsp:Transcript_9693/g.16823  ORF Transcript_9693/g.16823 Transcript_9693/m.16823 type:complete len:377 (-) Transcript_9693:708-1838(-)|eukprot:CAMPEP_0196664408 /NCGR_PEP_ID=MMETSP1086-20130531/57047_1 /TAXON_ID=77921 /ORGANISM="Cyanoptyche  gloeocystis , Strain SAG4.97" /LENGTH=376 /DNA_ID=CAMNT_0042000695 /DNA_START=98 /DNA_END=1228 /DNA_ORIENTATION=-
MSAFLSSPILAPTFSTATPGFEGCSTQLTIGNRFRNVVQPLSRSTFFQSHPVFKPVPQEAVFANRQFFLVESRLIDVQSRDEIFLEGYAPIVDPLVEGVEVRSSAALSTKYVSKNQSAMVENLSSFISQAADKAVREKGHFNICLPDAEFLPPIAEKLVSKEWKDQMHFEKWNVYFADEKLNGRLEVSNYNAAQELLIKPAGIPQENVHQIPGGSISAKDSAAAYAKDIPRFDLSLLGFRSDGHIGGLCPMHPILNERTQKASYVTCRCSQESMVALTLAAFNDSKLVAFLASGLKMRQLVQQALEGEDTRHAMPTSLVRPKDGQVFWFLDSAAASRLDRIGDVYAREPKYPQIKPRRIQSPKKAMAKLLAALLVM